MNILDDLIAIVVVAFILLSILAILVLIPVLVKWFTESEKRPNHVYNIFIEEAGDRGTKVNSAALCLMPLMVFSSPSASPEAFLVALFVGLGCAFYHRTVYKGYPVLTTKLKLAMLIAIVLFLASSIAARLELIASRPLVFIMLLSGFIWGLYAVYRRSKLIAIERGVV